MPARKLHDVLVGTIRQERLARGLRQADVAKRLRQQQSWQARVESGQRGINVDEFCKIAKAIGFDPVLALKRALTR